LEKILKAYSKVSRKQHREGDIGEAIAEAVASATEGR
jgi:hypothetical protein